MTLMPNVALCYLKRTSVDNIYDTFDNNEGHGKRSLAFYAHFVKF